jgi:predicted anti-sigma-YlaC factor YlaD
MKCDLIKDKLLESFGNTELTSDLINHLNECTECRQYYQELLSITDSIRFEEDFYLTQAERERFVAEVDKKIDQHELSKVTDITPKWKSYVPVAAAIVMILGIALVSQLSYLFDSSDQNNITDNNDSLWINIDKSEIEFVNNDNYENVLIDYSSVENSVSNDWIIDDVTEEEYQYMLDNFDIGEIL